MAPQHPPREPGNGNGQLPGPRPASARRLKGRKLSLSTHYEVDYTITFTPPSPGTPIVKTGSVLIPAHTSGNFAVTTTGTVSLISGVKYALTGSATLSTSNNPEKNRNTIPISLTNTKQEITCGKQGGLLTCRASALRVVEIPGFGPYEPVVANPP